MKIILFLFFFLAVHAQDTPDMTFIDENTGTYNDGFARTPKPMSGHTFLSQQQREPCVTISTRHTVNIGVDPQTVGMVIGGVIVVYGAFALYKFLIHVANHLTDNYVYKIRAITNEFKLLTDIEQLIEKTEDKRKSPLTPQASETLESILRNLKNRHQAILEKLKKISSKIE